MNRMTSPVAADLLQGAGGQLMPAGTAGSSVVYPQPEQTRLSARTLRKKTAALQDEIGLLIADAADLHQQVTEEDLNERAHAKAKKSVPDLLEELAVQHGMAWSGIARLVGVSVAAVRKWRAGGPASPENRMALARLAAFLDLLGEFAVQDPAQWLEMPLCSGYTVTAFDLYQAGHALLLLEFADNRISAQSMLDKADPEWRERYDSDYEVIEASDGNLSIRARRR